MAVGSKYADLSPGSLAVIWSERMTQMLVPSWRRV